MKRMGQFDDDGPILDHFGLAVVAAQEGGEVIVKPRFAQQQTVTKTLLAAQSWERSHLSGPDSL
jgi:hypothetical protein